MLSLWIVSHYSELFSFCFETLTMSLLAAKEGYLDVKTPAKSRGIRMLKAWRKRWIVISSKELNPPSLLIQVYASDSSLHKNRSLFCRVLRAENACVYRSRSRTHKHAFSIAENCDPALHFGGSSESQSQEWMACMRDLLWPPNPMEQVNTVLSGRYEVSLIDNEFSCRQGMLGTYGNLALAQNKLILTAPQTGCVINEWGLRSIKRYQLVPQTCREDSHKIFSLFIRDSDGLSGHLQFFSVDSVSIIEAISEMFNQYRESFDSLLDSPIEEHHDLIQFDDVFQRNEVATTDDELDVRISFGSSGSTTTSSSDDPLPLHLLSLPDHMLDCSITSSQVTPEYDSHSSSPPSSPYFNYDYDFSTELELIVECNRRASYSSIASHIYSDISSRLSSRRQSKDESIYEDIEDYQSAPPLPPRNLLSAYNVRTEKDFYDSPKNQLQNCGILFSEEQTNNKEDRFLNGVTQKSEISLNRTISIPVLSGSSGNSQQNEQSVSRSAPAPLCLPFSVEYLRMDHNTRNQNMFPEKQLLLQTLQFRQRSKTCPGLDCELQTLLTELNNSEPKHRQFRQCLKALSESSLLLSDFSLSTACCTELLSEFKRFSSDYCRMNPLTAENQDDEYECYDPDYLDMNGISSNITSTFIAQV